MFIRMHECVPDMARTYTVQEHCSIDLHLERGGPCRAWSNSLNPLNFAPDVVRGRVEVLAFLVSGNLAFREAPTKQKGCARRRTWKRYKCLAEYYVCNTSTSIHTRVRMSSWRIQGACDSSSTVFLLPSSTKKNSRYFFVIGRIL